MFSTWDNGNTVQMSLPYSINPRVTPIRHLNHIFTWHLSTTWMVDQFGSAIGAFFVRFWKLSIAEKMYKSVITLLTYRGQNKIAAIPQTTLKCIFLKENVWISPRNSLIFAPKVAIKHSSICCLFRVPDEIRSNYVFHIQHKSLLHHFVTFIWLPHDDIIKWKYFPRYWPFVRGIHRSPVKSSAQMPVTRSFDVFFDLRLNKWLSKQS